MDYRKFLERHYATNADVTISVIPSKPEDAEGFGLLKTDSNGKIIEFREKPKGEELEAMRVDTTSFGLTEEESERRPYLASMGIYVFDYEKLIELLQADDAGVDFGGEVIPSAIGKYNVQAHLFDGYWEDIGTIRSFYEANLDLASPLPKFNFFDTEAPIYTRSRYLPPSKIHDCDVDNSMVSEGCILNGVHARNAIFGLRSRIDGGVRIESSIIMGADFYESIEEIKANIERGIPHIGIGTNSAIRRAIIDKNVRIGKNVKLLNSGGLEHFDHPNGSFYIREGIIIVPKGATVADGTEI
jgi:glucose-1-phosphate adenylyltransferase